MFFKSTSRNCKMSKSWYSGDKYGLIFVTRERTDLIPFDAIFSCFGRKICGKMLTSRSSINVPCAVKRPLFEYIAFPENFLPSMRRSLRPCNSAPVAPILWRASITGSVNFPKSRKLSPSSSVMKQKQIFPIS